ncbi:response regulator [Methanobacterium sp. MBAC-LM]|uniref:response regulator n=1 Tax=Methanobacterium sp. MBAC-LM TaxID=3412034 RepID=UPI003C77166F
MKKPVKILLVEDNPADIRWTVEIFKEYHIPNEIQSVKDGAEALNFLYKKGKYKDNFYPDIIILDLYLPRINGHEVLKRIKNDKNLNSIHVVILTASNSPEDAKTAYKNHADCYISKPLDFRGLMKIIQRTGKFRLTVPAMTSKSKCQKCDIFSFKHYPV